LLWNELNIDAPAYGCASGKKFDCRQMAGIFQAGDNGLGGAHPRCNLFLGKPGIIAGLHHGADKLINRAEEVIFFFE
jgi:hypothetical protein